MILEDIKKWRRHLHQFPELSLQEYETTRYIREQLNDLGLTFFTPMDTATIVELKGNTNDYLLFRADIDALPIQEEVAVAFKSKHNNIMHACGHDGHTAMLLATLRQLKLLQDKKALHYSILAVFQPAEESFGGANLLIKAFDFSPYAIKGAYALHVSPEYDEGTFITRSKEFMASCNEFTINITGSAAHVGVRHEGVNALNAATLVYQQLQALPTYDLNDLHTNIIHVGLLEAGNAVNIVPQHATLKGTIRTYHQDDFKRIQKRMMEICYGLSFTTNCKIDLNFAVGYPAVINDSTLITTVEQAAIHANAQFILREEPYLLGEDFSFFNQIAPINFTFIGIKNEQLGYISGLHTPTLQFREEALVYGVQYFINLAKGF